MGKFDKEMAEVITRLDQPYLAFQYDTGYVVITQANFNKLNKRDKAKLLALGLPKKK